MPRRTSPPPWFVVAVAVACALALRLADALLHGHPVGVTDAPPVQLAFWGFFLVAVQWIWTGIQAAGQATLAALAWSVQALWTFATKIYDVAKAVGGSLWEGLRKSWDFLERTYEHVLKPAWQKFWKFIDAAKKWLDKYIGPVLRFLDKVRRHLLELYNRWVRPILDALGVARRVLSVLALFGIEWARALDRKLAAVEELIDGVFRRVLSELNAVINVVNRVVTLDGLFQRLALIRSIERDIRYVSRAFVNWRSKPLTLEEWDALRKRVKDRTDAEARADFIAVVGSGGGRHGPIASEMAATWRHRIEAP